MADDLTFNFSSEPAAAPARKNNNKGGRWTDRAKERKASKIEQRKAARPEGAAGGSRPNGGAQGQGGTKRAREDHQGDGQQRKRPSASGGGAGGGAGGRGRLERETGPGGKKQFISSLFTAEGLPEPSTSSAADAGPRIAAKPSNAPLTLAPAEVEEQDDGAGEKPSADEGPDPAPALSSLGLMRPLVAALASPKMGITGPTACQAGAIPRLVPSSSSADASKKGKGKAKGRKSGPNTADLNFAHDAILRAQTGSGKTLTFLLPMLQDLLTLDPALLQSTPSAAASLSTSSTSSSAHPDRSIGTLSLILAPTRELASQIHSVLSTLLASLPSRPSTPYSISPRSLTACLLVGGANRTHEKRRLRKGAPIVVATPGRLLDHLKTTEAFRLAGEAERPKGGANQGPKGKPGNANNVPLGPPRGRMAVEGGGGGAAAGTAARKLGLRWLVVDECDRLMDLGFEEQMRGILEEVEKRSGPSSSIASFPTTRRRTILCSATASAGVDRLAALSGGTLPLSAPVSEDDGEIATPEWPVIGASAAVQVEEPTRRDLTAPAVGGTKRSAPDDDEDAAEEIPVASTTALALPSGFTPPTQLQHHYLVVPPKLRFVALLALLRKLLRGPGGEEMKILVFMSCTEAVEFWWKACGGMKLGSKGGEAEKTEEEKLEEDDAKDGADGKKKKEEKLVSLHPLLPATPLYRLHGSLPLPTRLSSLAAFSTSYTIEEGKKKGQQTDQAVMFCTSVAARGLDVKGVGCVVQVDAPTEGGITEYVHRVGRTARAGAQGSAYSFLLPTETDYASLLEEGINAASAGKGDKKVRLRELGVEEVLRKGYGGEGREYETRATDVQMGFERWANGSEDTAAHARRAFQAHVRAYATHPSAEKAIFNTQGLHLGHLAKSFGMREAPGAGPQPSSKGGKGGNAAKRQKVSGGGAGGAREEEETGFQTGRRRKAMDAEQRMKKLMSGLKGNGGNEFQIAGVDDLKAAASVTGLLASASTLNLPTSTRQQRLQAFRRSPIMASEREVGLNGTTEHAAQRMVPSATFTPNSAFSPTPSKAPGRRSSFSSSDSRLVHSPSRGKSKGSTLPSIRSLKSKFLGALGAGSGGGRAGPNVVKGEEARKPIRIVSASVMGKPGGLKGFGGPAGAPSAGSTRSASTPASLHSLAHPWAHALRPSFNPGEGQPPLPVSLDAILSGVAEAERSPAIRPKTADGSAPSRHQRAISPPYVTRSALSPHSPHVRSPSHPPLSLPPSQTPTPLPAATLPQPSPQREPIIRPISADFTRPTAAPPLLALRRQQQRDSLHVERSRSRSGHRHSRILPGAAPPSSLISLQRTKSLSAPSSEEKRGRHWSVQPQPLHPPLPQPERSTWDAPVSSRGRRQSRPVGTRRHSLATSSSVSPKEEESHELDEGEKEAHRGRSLSALLGQAKLGLGLSGGPKEAKDLKGEPERQPSKPFPGGFEEVPYRPSIDASALAAMQKDDVSPTNASPAAFARPLSLPAIVHEQQSRQHRRKASFPDTPPPSAKRNHRQSDSSLVVPNSRRPSVATSTAPPSAAIPSLPPSELTLPHALQPGAVPSLLSSSTSASPPKHVSSLPPVSSPLPMRKSKSAIELMPSPFLAASSNSPPDLPVSFPLPLHGAGAAGAAIPVFDLPSARAPVEVSADASTLSRRSSEQVQSGSEYGDDEQEESLRRGVTSMPDGRSFAQVIEESHRGGRALDSPLSELIEELRSRQSSVAGSPVVNSPQAAILARGGPAAEGDSEESEEDEEEGEVVDSPNFSRKDSQGDGAHPFMLAAYLNSPLGSPSVGKKRRSKQSIQQPPMPSLDSSVFFSGAVPTLGELSSSASSYATAGSAPSPPSAFLVPISSPSAATTGPLTATQSSLLSTPDRTLTLNQMEREIARMEAELALSGCPHSFYDNSTPKAAQVAAFSSSTPVPTSLSATQGATTPSLSELGVPVPASEPESPSSAAQALDSSTPPTSSSAPPGSSSLSQVTPRTARRWSIFEIEKAYDRMKKMLGSSASSTPGVGGRNYAASDITEERSDMDGAEVDHGRDEKGLAKRTGGEGAEEQEVLDAGHVALDVESALDAALAQASNSSGRDEGDSGASNRSSWSPNLHLKPLPGLPPPTPSPNADRLAASAPKLAPSHGRDTAASTTVETSPPTSLPDSTSPTSAHYPSLSLKPSHDSLSSASAPPAWRSTPSRLAQHRLIPSPSHECLRLASSSGHKRKDSDASSVGGAGSGIKKLVLPATNQTRLRTRATQESLRDLSLSSPAEEAEIARQHDNFASAASPSKRTSYDQRARANMPLSPTRRTGPRASSRLSSSGPLRSAIGRDLQRLATPEGRRPEEENENDQLFSPASASPSINTIATRRSFERERSAMSVHRLLPPSSSMSVLDGLRDPRWRSGTARRAGTGGSDAASWYPVTPNRLSMTSAHENYGGLARYRSDSLSTTGSVHRTEGAEDDEGERESLASGSGLEESDRMAKASLNVASIRGMDKLEIYFKYTAARADLEKAELERDALLDALRETRSTLSDIRRQRDTLDQENKRERLLTRQVKKFLGGDPDRYVDKLENLVEARRGWEMRAREALEELERTKDELEATRRELVDGREREELLERENVMVGARLAAMEGSRSESLTLRLPPPAKALPFPSASTPTPRRSHHGSTSTIASSHHNEHRPNSPTITMSRSTSEQTALAPASSKPLDVSSATLAMSAYSAPTPSGAARNASISTATSGDSLTSRHASKDSFASSSSGIEPAFSDGMGDVSSPLMGQTMMFGPKLSYGSTNASPLKARSFPPTAFPHRGQFPALRLGDPPSSSHSSLRPLDRLCHFSTRTTTAEEDEDDEDESDFADRSFDSTSSGPAGGLGKLREKDEAFLADLTTEIEGQAEGNRT
ncbi:hypothetical protein JCM11251_002009 [Rhodosporidiobolus azoricus]